MMEAMKAMELSFDRMMGASERKFGLVATQQSTPPAPQEARKEKANKGKNTESTAEKQEQQPLRQANVEELRPKPLYQASVEDERKSSIPNPPRYCSW